MAKLIPLNYQWIHDDPITRPTFQHDGITEPLEAIRCIHQTGARQCLRRSIYTIPMCWQHLKSDYNVIVKQTTLTDANGDRLAGLGLFACNHRPVPGQVDLVFVRDQVIVPYVGKEYTRAQYDAKYPGDAAGPYGVPIENNRVVDAGPMRGVAALANDCRVQNRNRGDCERNNARIDEAGAGNYPVLVATRNIFDGDEIFINYGASYWSGVPRAHRTVAPRNAYNRLRYKCR